MIETYLYHHGILGMKWGIRRFQNKDGTLTEEGKKRYSIGNGLELEEVPKYGLAKALGKVSKRIKEEQEKSLSFEIKAGEKYVGELDLYKVSPEEINTVWIGINAKERGKGYAQTVMDWVIKYSKEEGYAKLTLEVPGNSPDARHVYEKKGFKETGILTTREEDPYWDGLTKMEKKLR